MARLWHAREASANRAPEASAAATSPPVMASGTSIRMADSPQLPLQETKPLPYLQPDATSYVGISHIGMPNSMSGKVHPPERIPDPHDAAAGRTRARPNDPGRTRDKCRRSPVIRREVRIKRAAPRRLGGSRPLRCHRHQLAGPPHELGSPDLTPPRTTYVQQTTFGWRSQCG